MWRGIAPVFVCLVLAVGSKGAWFDGNWTFRRAVDVNWEAEKNDAEGLAEVDFYTEGTHKPNAEDVRVATAEGKLVAWRVLMVGPGDWTRVVFSLSKGVRRYYVYWGNPNPSLAPKGSQDLVYEHGLLLVTQQWPGGAVENFKQIEEAWKRSTTVIGGKIIDRPYLGYNPFGEQQQWISKLSGAVMAPVDGEYTFAVSADDRGALFLDGKPLVFAPFAPGDIRFNAKTNLNRGRHEFLFYHVNIGGEGRFTVGWKRPDTNKVDVIESEAFGTVRRGIPGPLEEFQKNLTADFKLEYLGECFVGGNYSHRLRFKVAGAKLPEGLKVEWDFGDGQKASESDLEHVYLTEGVYAVKLSYRVGPNSDEKTTKIRVSRDYDRIVQPPTDGASAHCKIIAAYNVAKMPAAWLSWAVLLHLQARQTGAMFVAAGRLAGDKSHGDVRGYLHALQEATRAALVEGRTAEALKLWDVIPGDSDLNPTAARYHAQYLLWWAPDLPKALNVLEPFAPGKDPAVNRLYGQALVLSGQADQGRKILESLPVQDSPAKQAAISGALARTIEFFIKEGDWETGEDYWERWQARYPADFLEGYSLLLKTRLMEIRKFPQASAKVAEAFAAAVPSSSYSPQLLDRASKLLAKSDPTKSAELRNLLKQRYPEDPLSQDK